ncbi:SprT-like protease [Mycobacterium phage PhelpsODU]|uniref:SprT-like protease n=1 Tax=Mycobacterium phage Unicorn TaxID=2015825 RepID=A0A222ZL47_9CAUD|nr:SprT-like protease [Mycobacterium phage Unicorn]ASR85089.1 SprT-like protease [Mycobacterium phage Unicorn]ASR85189.1 SprT-like protease [Mycobacterium phage PhelpsODU]
MTSTARHMTPAQARAITLNLLRDHGLTGWSVRYDNARRRAGMCSYRERVISLSKPLMAQRSYDDTWMTITHEIAHALVGPSHGHDAVWSAKHRSLGGDGKRCFEHLDESAPWMGTCAHGKQFARYRAPKQLHGWRCRCVRGGSPITWQTREQRATEAAAVAQAQARRAQPRRVEPLTSAPVGRGVQLDLF